MDADKVILEIFATEDTSDNLPRLLKRGNRVDLGRVFKKLQFMKGVEVGTRKGEFATALCDANRDMHLWCVDPWMAYDAGHGVASQERQEKLYAHAMNQIKGHNITVIRKTSMDAVSEFEDQSVDFVYIDANHQFDFVVCDLIYWAPKVRMGGIVALHDYRPGHWAGVVEAVDAYTKCHDIRPWYITREKEPTAFWVRRS